MPLQLRTRMAATRQVATRQSGSNSWPAQVRQSAQRWFCATTPHSVRLKPNSCQVRPRLFRAGHTDSVGPKPGNFTPRSLAQINGRRQQALACRRGIEVELIAGRSAPKTAIHVLLEVGGKTAAFRRCRAMHRTRAADFLFRSFARREPQQGENLCQADARADLWKSNAGHRQYPN